MKTIFILILFFFFAVNSFTQWQPDVRLTNDPASSLLSYNNAHCLAAEGENLYVVWSDGRDMDAEIYYKRSSDNGLTWQQDTRLTNSTGRSEYPSIAVSGLNVHTVWMDDRDESFHYEIYYSRSTDGGISWQADLKLTSNPSEPGIPSLAVSGNNVHIVWHDIRDGNWEIYYKHSTDNGITWQPDIRLTIDGSVSERASIAMWDNSIYVVWQDERDSDKEIYYKKSTDNGTNWSQDIRLTNSVGESESPTIAVEESNIYIVWSDSRNGIGNAEIYFKGSTDSGTNWSEDIRITNTPIASNRPTVAVSSNFVHISWNEVWEIYYTRSTDYGNTWETETRITNNTSDSQNSFVVTSDSAVHLIWQDNPANNDDIYYKRNPTGNIITDIDWCSNNIPNEFILYQNYPNPFNPSTAISWQSPVSSWQTIIIYNSLGEAIETIVDGYYEVGIHSKLYNENSSLPSGIYFYQLKAGEYVKTKKMLLLK